MVGTFSYKKPHIAAPFFSLFYTFFRKGRNSRTNNFPIISLVGRATQGNSLNNPLWGDGVPRLILYNAMYNRTIVA